MALNAVPPTLKAISHYLKTANELLKLEEPETVVAYYCRIYAVQKALKISESKPECRKFIYQLMDVLEKMKGELAGEEVMQNDVVAGVHVENYALKVFEFADNEDRASRFSRNVVKSFYTAGLLFDVLSTFGELSEEITHKRKYAKWKALYINKCLKENTIPIPGPMANEEEFGGDEAMLSVPQPGTSSGQTQPNPSDMTQPASYGFNLIPPGNVNVNAGQIQPPGAHAPPSTPQEPQAGAASSVPSTQTWTPTPAAGNVSLTPHQYQQAMKYCKYASSALQYEDSATAVDNLNKALRLITTGQDS
ncbi:vacuolar protein sorting-associated protein VTA1 homolog [Tubulanus polymorphus]|uniref:vacuolar protein sorting-associated protein VTA1 homolog n=1 Tax=Tubulanus polymorphus TaxID=672921 RepID=UPI003DA586F2